MSISEKLDRSYKILLLGDSAVGKSCLFRRYTDNEYEPGVATTGVDLQYKYLSFQDKKIRLEIWDTAGQERFRGITKNYYNGAHGIIFVFDVTQSKTFMNVKNWIKDVKNNLSKGRFETVIVGNKIDLVDEREVMTKSLEEFGEKHMIETFEASAKTGEGVDVFFQKLVEKLFANGKIGIINKDGELEERPKSISLSKEDAEDIRNDNGGDNKSKNKNKKDKKGCGC